MSDIKAILFDFGGTLDNDGVDWFTRMYRGIGEQYDGLDRQAFQTCAETAANRLDSFDDTRTLTMSGVVHRIMSEIHKEVLLLDSEQHGQWDPDIVAKGFVAESETFLVRNLEIVKQLQGKFRLGCISNNWGNTSGWCEQYGFDQLFEVMIDSTLVNSMKPDKVIFEAALEGMKLTGLECAYVGDRYDYDVIGSSNLGFAPVWITHNAYYGQVDGSVQPDTIHALNELHSLDWIKNR